MTNYGSQKDVGLSKVAHLISPSNFQNLSFVSGVNNEFIYTYIYSKNLNVKQYSNKETEIVKANSTEFTCSVIYYIEGKRLIVSVLDSESGRSGFEHYAAVLSNAPGLDCFLVILGSNVILECW